MSNLSVYLFTQFDREDKGWGMNGFIVASSAVCAMKEFRQVLGDTMPETVEFCIKPWLVDLNGAKREDSIAVLSRPLDAFADVPFISGDHLEDLTFECAFDITEFDK